MNKFIDSLNKIYGKFDYVETISSFLSYRTLVRLLANNKRCLAVVYLSSSGRKLQFFDQQAGTIKCAFEKPLSVTHIYSRGIYIYISDSQRDWHR